MEFRDILKSLRKKNKVTQEELAARIKVERSSVGKYETGTIPSYDTLSRIADYFHVSVDYLLGRDTPPDLADTVPGLLPITRKKFPLLGEIACGEPTWQEEHHETMVESTDTIDADFCLRASGDSMTGSQIDDGDIVFIKQTPLVDNGDIAAVLIGDETTLKRVDYDPDAGLLILLPDNPAYRPLVFRGDELNQIRILGRAVMIQKRIKKRKSV